ncbi:MAG TPA: hypothetical protein PK955_05310, partial [Methanoregulaceae archaeon]|nr:hypothetical protein [Methanoregulaceae archaeon]
MVDCHRSAKDFGQVGDFNCVRHPDIPSNIIADAKENHPLVASDLPVLILSNGYKMQGFHAMPGTPGSDDPLPLENDKYHGIWFRMRWDFLASLKADEDDI